MARKADPNKVKPPTAREAADALPVDGLTPAQEFVQGAITRAAGLIEAKHAIQADLQKSRDFLAFASSGTDMSDAQRVWTDAYLPKRTHGASDDAGEDS